MSADVPPHPARQAAAGLAAVLRRQQSLGVDALPRDSMEAWLRRVAAVEAALAAPAAARAASRAVDAAVAEGALAAPARAVSPAPPGPSPPARAASPESTPAAGDAVEPLSMPWAAVAEPAESLGRALQTPLAGDSALLHVRRVLGECTRCRLCSGRSTIVFGVGDPQARLMFVGEGPGAEEDRQGEPFVGPAGGLLTRMIGAMGLSRQEVYIANVVKCRPPNNRAPDAAEMAACLPFLRAQIAAVRPQVLVALGGTALTGLVGKHAGITRERGQWRTWEGVPLMPTWHPAYILRQQDDAERMAKREAWQDLQQVMQRLGLQGGAG
jgi:DNA polymerase